MTPSSSPPPLFRFTTQRQREIYRRLQLIGDGPAANFHDACHIMADDSDVHLQSGTHVVGHLLREIESAIRDVLVTFAQHDESAAAPANIRGSNDWATDESGSEDTQRKEIQQVLRLYQIEEASQVGQLWLALAGKARRAPTHMLPLHAAAHRNALARPRPLDATFRRFWDDVLTLLDVILGYFEYSYGTAIDVVDELLTREQPRREDVKRLREAVPNSRVVLSYFFDHCEDPQWIAMLKAKGFFARPPGLEIDEETGVALGYPIWPASRYLVRMARLPKARADVEQVIRSIMSTDNVRVRQDILEILSYLPVDRIADLVVEVAGWLDFEV